MYVGSVYVESCNCEHASHFPNDAYVVETFGDHMVHGAHAYMAVAAGEKAARYVGRICDMCAETCMKSSLVSLDQPIEKDAWSDDPDRTTRRGII